MIKVVFEGPKSPLYGIDTLTSGKIYESSVSSTGHFYLIFQNDYGKKCLYPKSLFKTLEEFRSDKLNIIFS